MVRRRRNPAYKQMAYETAIRNPDRYLGILTTIQKHVGTILDDENLLDIVSELYLKGEVTSKGLTIDETSTIENIKEQVKAINITRRSDGGFPAGYPSRFWTYMRTLSEMGFVYAQYNEKLLISEMGMKFIEGEIDAGEAFSVQAIRTNRKSPYRNVSNNYNYFIFIINVLMKLKEKKRKLSYHEFIVSTFSKMGDEDEFIKLIAAESFSSPDETIMFILGNYPRINKYQTVMVDYPDVVLRMLRITGFVTITSRNGSIYLELNESKQGYYNDLLRLNFKLSDEAIENPKTYFEETGYYSSRIKEVIFKNREKDERIENYNTILKNIITTYELNTELIIKNINTIGTKKKPSDIIFKYIPDAVKLEFFISILMYIKYGDKFQIKPNYKTDANGIPIYHAPKEIGDIEVFSEKIYWLVEVTLLKSKVQQLNNETTNLIRHLNTDEKYNETYLSLVAPIVHVDTRTFFDASVISLIAQGTLKKINAKPYTIKDFIEFLINKDAFLDMKEYTENIKNNLRANL